MDTRVNTQIYLEKKRFESEICFVCHCTSPVVSLGVCPPQPTAQSTVSILCRKMPQNENVYKEIHLLSLVSVEIKP